MELFLLLLQTYFMLLTLHEFAELPEHFEELSIIYGFN